MKNLRVQTALVRCMAFLLVFAPKSLWACAVCFGKSDSRLAEGMNWGILTLLVVVGCVLTGIASFFFYLMRKSASMAAASMPADAPKACEKI